MIFFNKHPTFVYLRIILFTDFKTFFELNGARYYNPLIGRFITADTIVPGPHNPQSLNRYSYCLNNPVNRIDPSGHWSWKKFWNSFAGAFVGAAAAVLLGPAGFALVGTTMAGIIGGSLGGAITGGLEGGWKGMLIGAAAGGALGGLGGWAIGGEHYGVLAGMFVVGAGAAGTTDSWDSFAGGFTGGITGGALSSGVAKSEQFQNWKAGDGWVSNRDAQFNEYATEMRARYALNANQKDSTVGIVQRPLGKNLANDPGSTTGPRHRAIISDQLKNGKFEMGPDPMARQITTTNKVDNLSGWGTHNCTEKSLSLGGRYVESFNVDINMSALQENIAFYESTFVGKFSYIATDHNSNFAVNSVIYGAGGDVPIDGWTPGFPDMP